MTMTGVPETFEILKKNSSGPDGKEGGEGLGGVERG